MNKLVITFPITYFPIDLKVDNQASKRERVADKTEKLNVFTSVGHQSDPPTQKGK
jgi:hypothetical protein